MWCEICQCSWPTGGFAALDVQYGIIFAVRRILTCFVAFVALAAFADESPQFVPGLLPQAPGKEIRVRALASARRAPLLRSTPDELPAYWNSASNGWVTSVKDQKDLGNCWSFAALAPIETQLLKSGRGEYDFSEKNMAKLSAMVGYNGNGAYANSPAGYLLRWSGPVAETDDPYIGTQDEWNATNSPALPSELHVQEVVWIPALDGTEERRAQLKRAIRDYGAIATTMYWGSYYANSNDTYYCYNGSGANHAITLVGWDDNIPKKCFKNPPASDGAWIIKNSWGTDVGDGGFCYISYCDTGFARSECTVYLPAADDAAAYDAVHGYAFAGPYYDTSISYDGCFPQMDSDLQAVVFTAASGESLAAVGLWTAVYPYEYEISVYTNVVRHTTSRWEEVVPCVYSTKTYGTVYPSEDPLEGGTCALQQSGVLTRGGYTTVPLEREIPLAPGTSYAIVFRQTGSAASILVAIDTPVPEDPIYGLCAYRPGNGYLGWSKNDATNRWFDAYDCGLYAADPEGWALCLTAYTRLSGGGRASDLPSATDDGATMLAELSGANASQAAARHFNETYGFEPLAKLVGANGRSLWANWLLGLDPANADVRDIMLSINFSSGVPRVSWDPAIPDRTYTLYGCDSLSPDASWYAVSTNELDTTSARFFRLSIDQQQ